MTKKRSQTTEEEQRQSRKELLIARKHERQTRQIRLAVIGVIALVAIVLFIGIINEFFLKPASPVAVVNGVEIALAEWQDRVRLQRAQLIIGIEDLAEAFGQDIGQVQQFAGQQINLLQDPQTLGQLVLDQLVDEEIIRQAAEARGITVTDADIQKEIEENFNFYGGASPTALPTATETPIPTPSITPIPTAVITDVVPPNTPFPTPTLGPTGTPLPTPTAISPESFRNSFDEAMGRFRQLSGSEDEFRAVIRAQLYEKRLKEALGTEEEVSDEALQTSFFYLAFDTKEEAVNALKTIDESDYLSTWNTIRSRPTDAETESTAFASELLWRTQKEVQDIFGEAVSESVFKLAIGEPSEVLVIASQSEGEPDRYTIVMVSGREVRPLSESAIESARQEILASWLDAQRLSGLEILERWRSNVPRRPILDTRFLVPPTPAPATPTIELSIPELTVTPGS